MLLLNLPIPSRLRPRAIGNEHLEHFLQEQDCAYRMGGFINYAIYIVDSEQENQKLCGAGRAMLKMYDAVIRYLSRIQHDMNQSIAEESRFVPDADFAQMKKMAAPNIHSGGCLVSHVCGRGIVKRLHERYPNVNIQTVEYDYDSARTLRESRIMLGISGQRNTH